MIASNLQKEVAACGLELSVHVSYYIITKEQIKQTHKIAASVMCQRQICSDISYCNPSSSCSNCKIPQGMDCICYGGKVYTYNYFYFGLQIYSFHRM